MCRDYLKAFAVIFCVFSQIPTYAGTAKLPFALKSGESVEVEDLYYVINCRSLLTGAPEVTIMEGPPGVTVVVNEANVTPRSQKCARPVKGGKLLLKADHIEEQSESDMTLRLKYPTKDGDRYVSLNLTISLFP